MTPENVSIFSEVRSWLEILYFISQIVVVFLIAIGLRQLQLAKRQIETTKEIFRTQSKRAAVEAAVVECRRFAETIIQDKLALDKFCDDNKVTYFEDAKFTRTDTGFSIDTKSINKDDLPKLSNANDLINRLLNGVESYALFFLSGVADENIAFHTNAKTYIEMAEHLFKLFPICNVEIDDAEPIKDLYFRWRKKYEVKKLRVEQKEIENKLSTFKDSSLKAIGT